jgi:phenylpropionate dioxygenase-like ring-hydroxylating dioxygenase large terminal subunit
VPCCYHGWLYDPQGQCVDMPCETEEFRKPIDVWQTARPATKYGGLVRCARQVETFGEVEF